MYFYSLVFLGIYYVLGKYKIIRKDDYHISFLMIYFSIIGGTLFNHDFIKVLLYVITNYIFVELVISIFITHKNGNNDGKTS